MLKPKATPDEIAAELRAEMLRGAWEPGKSLRQDEIAARFGVSRVPVREALRSLCAEGLAIWRAQRGFTVAQLKPDEARELLEIRAVLEIQALRWAFENIDKATLEQAKAALERAEATESIDAWSDLNAVFHQTLLEPCGRPMLLEMIGQLNNRVDRYIRLLILRGDYRDQAEAEHRAILAAAAAKNVEAAALLLTQHIEGTAGWLDDFLAREQGKPTPPKGASGRARRG